jgi:hypothetical protein
MAAIMRDMGKGKLVTAHAIKVYGGEGVQLHSFLTLAPDEPGGQLHSREKAPSTH